MGDVADDAYDAAMLNMQMRLAAREALRSGCNMPSCKIDELGMISNEGGLIECAVCGNTTDV